MTVAQWFGTATPWLFVGAFFAVGAVVSWQEHVDRVRAAQDQRIAERRARLARQHNRKGRS